MIAVDNQRQETQPTWQAEFVAILPEIQQRLRYAFRQLRAEAAEDAIEEGVIHALLSYVRLFKQGALKRPAPQASRGLPPSRSSRADRQSAASAAASHSPSTHNSARASTSSGCTPTARGTTNGSM